MKILIEYESTKELNKASFIGFELSKENKNLPIVIKPSFELYKEIVG